MNDLRKELAPITTQAWEEIEEEATRALKTGLAARKLVDFNGPLGWSASAVNRGRTQDVANPPGDGVQARLRQVKPLAELRVPFTLSRSELDDIGRGAEDADLDPLVRAAMSLAQTEDRIAFHGWKEAGIEGMVTASPHKPVKVAKEYAAFAHSVAEAMETLRAAGVDGPYAIALDGESYTNLAKTTGPQGGELILRHLQRLLEGEVIWAPALDGALLVSKRGGDFTLSIGRDISIGYLDHDRENVDLYLEESLTFDIPGPEACVALNTPGK